MTINEQVGVIEKHIHSPHAGFTLLEQMSYMAGFFGSDPEYSKAAIDIVRGNISKRIEAETRQMRMFG